MKTIGIVGSRRRNAEEDFQVVKELFFGIYEFGDRICSGGCPKGADRFAERLAKEHRIPIKIFPAEWLRFGRGAGLIRNTDIAKNSDVLIACVSKDRTGGTEDTIKKFRKFKPENKIILC